MITLYHFVPKNMQGMILYPLNEMENKLPKLFKKQNSKYKGRESIKSIIIPGLGTWNDVIHLSPINPNEAMKALAEAGAHPDFTWKAFVIDTSTLDPSKLVLIVIKKDGENTRRAFMPLSQKSYDANHYLPELTKQYYRQAVARGEQPLIYAGAPHVMYGGQVDTKHLKIIAG